MTHTLKGNFLDLSPEKEYLWEGGGCCWDALSDHWGEEQEGEKRTIQMTSLIFQTLHSFFSSPLPVLLPNRLYFMFQNDLILHGWAVNSLGPHISNKKIIDANVWWATFQISPIKQKQLKCKFTAFHFAQVCLCLRSAVAASLVAATEPLCWAADVLTSTLKLGKITIPIHLVIKK